MKTHTKNQSRRRGFSMVEVLVASTILVVIVMMLGMLFQQTSLAWRTGVKRADGFMQVRAAIGAIQRDAAAAVDARYLPQTFVSGGQQFSGGTLTFYTLTGKDENRALTKVTYSSSGRRTESVLQANGSWGSETSGSVLPSSGHVGNTSSTTIQNFEAHFGQSDLNQQGLPLYVTFAANVSASGANLEIGAASAGPDRQWGTKDDIKTWVEN